MRIDCLHGYFIFTETQAGQISDFMSRFGLEIERSGDHFTFADLVDAPEYCLAGSTYLGMPVLNTFAGKPWEIMRENDLVYDFNRGLVVPIASVIQPIEIETAGSFFLSSGMILPGSVTDDGTRVTDYSAFYSFDRGGFKYSEVDSD